MRKLMLLSAVTTLLVAVFAQPAFAADDGRWGWNLYNWVSEDILKPLWLIAVICLLGFAILISRKASVIIGAVALIVISGIAVNDPTFFSDLADVVKDKIQNGNGSRG
jgi:hypothetical protein